MVSVWYGVYVTVYGTWFGMYGKYNVNVLSATELYS